MNEDTLKDKSLAVLLVFVVTATMAKNRLKREGKTAL